MFVSTSLLFIISKLVVVCDSESLPIPSALSIVSIARSSNVGINEGVNSLVNRHKSCPEGYELGRELLCIYLLTLYADSTSKVVIKNKQFLSILKSLLFIIRER